MHRRDEARDDIDPKLEAFLQRRARHFPAVDLATLPLCEGRKLYAERSKFGHEGLAYCRTEEFEIALPSGPIAARLYRPQSGATRHAILYVHGGGWIFGDIDTHDGLMRNLCRASGALVVGINYRLAPETPFPGPLEDCVGAFRWLQNSARAMGADPHAITIAGDSAGACMALSSVLVLADFEAPEALMLLYGCYAPDFSTPSHRSYGDGRYGISSDAMRHYWDCYCGRGEPPRLAAPLRSGLEGLPPIYLGASALDPLRDDTLLLANRLAERNLRSRVDIWEGCTHSFLQLPDTIPVVAAAIDDAVAGWKAVRASR